MIARTRVLLTFDVEDTKSPDAFRAISMFLSILERNGLSGIFFITGEMAARLKLDNHIVERLRNHEIGYHSAIHSARPTMVELLDLRNFSDAVQKSRRIETETGALRNLRLLFGADVTKFRAPRMCWNPAHMVALRELGIECDFSADFSEDVVQSGGIVFFPYPVWADRILSPVTWARFFIKLVRGSMMVVALHPSMTLYRGVWDWESMTTKMGTLERQKPASSLRVAARIVLYRIFFGLIRICENLGLIDTHNTIPEVVESLTSDNLQPSRVYRAAVYPSLLYTNYLPKHWLSQLEAFIQSSTSAIST